MGEKICYKCKEKKPFDLFYKSKRYLNGFDGKCKDCHQSYYLENKDRLLKLQKEKYIKEDGVKRVKEWREKKYGNKSEEREKKKIEKLKIKNQKKQETQYKIEYIYPLKRRIRSMIWTVLNKKELPKKTNNSFYLGCDYEFLKTHIEKQFTKGMDWDNKEYWHLDHIIPLSFAKTKDDIIPLFHYSNLQPLWAEQNRKKGAKVYALTNLHFNKTYY